MQMIVGGQYVAARHHRMATGQIADITSRLAHQQEPGGDVPRCEPELPEPLKPASGHVGQIERGRTDAADV